MWVVQPYLPVLFLCQWSLLLSQFWEITKGDQLFLSDLTYSRNHVYFFIQLLFIENLLCGRYCDSVNLFSLLNNLVSYSLCLLFIYLFIYLFIIVVQLQLSPFPPSPPSRPIHTHLLPSILPRFGFVHCSFIHVSWWPISFFPLLSPFPLPSDYHQSVLYSNVSDYILLACFVDQVPLIGENIWYFSFTAWLISLSIMLFRTIHAVMKGRSFFFVSTV